MGGLARRPPNVPSVPGRNLPAVPPPPARVPDATPQAASDGGWLGWLATVGATGLAGTAAIRALTGGSDDPPPDQQAAPAPPEDNGQWVSPTARGYTTQINPGTLEITGYAAPGDAAGFEGQRKRWLREQTVRHRQQIAQNPMLRAQLEAAYDAGAQPGVGIEAGKGTAHMRGAQSAQRLVDTLRDQDEAQRWLNVDARRKQQNISQEMGVPRGYVMAHDDVQESLRRGDRAGATAKAAMYGQMYPGFDQASANLAAMYAADSAAGAKQAEIAAKNPMHQLEQSNKAIGQMPAGMQRHQAIQMDAGMRLGQGAKPEAVNQAVMQRYMPIIRGYAGRLNNLNADELMEVQTVLGSMPYSQVPTYLGLPDTRELQDWWQRAIGPQRKENASWAQYFDGWGLGNAWRGTTPWAD